MGRQTGNLQLRKSDIHKHRAKPYEMKQNTRNKNKVLKGRNTLYVSVSVPHLRESNLSLKK